MEIIDSQLHVYPPAILKSPPPSLEHHRLYDADALIAAMDAVGVDASILILPSALGFDPSYAQESAERYRGRFGVVVRLDPRDPAIEENVAALGHDPHILGLRVILWREEQLRDLLADIYEPTFSAAERHGIPVMVYPPRSHAAIGDLARAHPDLQLVLDHLALAAPPLVDSEGNHFAALPEMLELARYDNIAVKCSGAPALSAKRFPFTDIWPHLHCIFDAFGVDRVMWGSDITRCDNHTYCEALSYLRHSSEISASEKERILGKTLRRILKWYPPRQD